MKKTIWQLHKYFRNVKVYSIHQQYYHSYSTNQGAHFTQLTCLLIIML